MRHQACHTWSAKISTVLIIGCFFLAGKHLPQVYADLKKSTSEQKLIDKAVRLINIWQERAIFERDFLAKLREVLVHAHFDVALVFFVPCTKCIFLAFT
jgi:hypothetical protein